jgi:hypothetical protein
VVQLGGLEPPTSCSTDRRSNQLSYNCIVARGSSKGAGELGRKLGATPGFGKARTKLLPGRLPASARWYSRKRPGTDARAFPQLSVRSGGGLVIFRRVGLDRLDGFGGNTLAEFGEFLGLGIERLELLAGM